MISIRLLTKKSTSSFVLSSLKVILREPLAQSDVNPMASKTCDGAKDPVEHALPLDAHIPFASNFNSKASPSTFLNEKLQFPGNLFSLLPFTFTSTIFSSTWEIQ